MFDVNLLSIRPTRAQVGDVLILTKPLGIQVAVNAHQWLRLPEKYEKIASIISKNEGDNDKFTVGEFPLNSFH